MGRRGIGMHGGAVAKGGYTSGLGSGVGAGQVAEFEALRKRASIDIAVKKAGVEAVTGSYCIAVSNVDRRQRQTVFAMEDHGSLGSTLDHEDGDGPAQRRNRAIEIRLARKPAGLALIGHQDVDVLQRFGYWSRPFIPRIVVRIERCGETGLLEIG
jgi:hypothetical protein